MTLTVTPSPVDEGPPTPDIPAAPAGPEPGTSDASASSNVERATAITEELIERGAPWSTETSWTIVLVEGIAAAVLGLLFLFKPLGGSATALQLVGLMLLLGALITGFQLWRHKIRPEIENLAAFRTGSGVTVGLVTIVATFFTAVTDSVTAALAVVVGVGFIIFGLAGIASSFVRRTGDAPLPLIALIINAALALAGLVLMLAGAAGASSVDSIFTLLGLLLIVAGLGLAGYSYLLRQQEMSGVR
jgi:uncharacterized membrane protein HdeD (DUF308 family)